MIEDPRRELFFDVEKETMKPVCNKNQTCESFLHTIDAEAADSEENKYEMFQQE